MKAKKQDIELRELFRNRLGNAELIPDPSVNTKLMRKLARREFVHFNPARFNIYYLGSMLVTGIAAFIILSTGESNSFRSEDDNLKTELYDSTVVPVVIIQDTTNALFTPVSDPGKSPVKERTKALSIPDGSSEDIPGSDIQNHQQKVTIHTEVNDSLSTNHMFTKGFPGTDKLIDSNEDEKGLFESSVSEGCTPLKVRFISTSGDYDSYRWTFGDGGSSSEKATEWIFDVEGEYKVVLEVYSSGKLIATSSSLIKVFPKPVASFEINPEKAIVPDDEIHFINYSADAIKYLWDFGDGFRSVLFEPDHKYNKYGNYDVRLVAYSEYGCSDSMIVHNAFSGSEYFIKFPNAFIPNSEGSSGGIYSSKSDEAAQVFHPVFSGVSDYQLKIFSRRGILIFETNDINIGWDGYLNGQISNPGVYVWKVRGKFNNGEPFIKMGDLTLLKY